MAENNIVPIVDETAVKKTGETVETQAKKISVEVAYARLDTQLILPLQVDEGTTAEQAIQQSGVLKSFPEIDLTKNKIGIFSKICKMDKVLREKDRVEIYRPLIADPKQVRKQRAAEGKKMRKGGNNDE